MGDYRDKSLGRTAENIPLRTMFPNARSDHWDQPRNFGPPRPKVDECTLNHGKLQIEQKEFLLTLKENVRGRFLRIVEHNGDRIESIMVPDSGLEDFYAIIALMVKADHEFPPALPSDAQIKPQQAR